MIEQWKDISGYENKYQISNFGQVKSLNFNHSGHEKIMKTNPNDKGYLQICLTKNNIKHTHRVHRLVAEAFIPNPNNLPCVNHIDETKLNNNVENLEWCTFTENTQYGTRSIRCGRPINQFSLEGDFIKTFLTSKDAERETGVYHSHILACCHKKPHCLTTGGYKWEFASNSRNTLLHIFDNLIIKND